VKNPTGTGEGLSLRKGTGRPSLPVAYTRTHTDNTCTHIVVWYGSWYRLLVRLLEGLGGGTEQVFSGLVTV